MMTGKAIPVMATATTRTTLEAATAGTPAARREPEAAAGRTAPPIPVPEPPMITTAIPPGIPTTPAEARTRAGSCSPSTVRSASWNPN